jgi:hypothetical protein
MVSVGTVAIIGSLRFGDGIGSLTMQSFRE